MQVTAQTDFDKTTIKSIMKQVADWQIANPNKGAEPFTIMNTLIFINCLRQFGKKDIML